jgi:4-alpha-glucanotransferase
MDLPLFNWLDTRAAGVLLHPTCLPGDQGIGTLGDAGRFLDFLQAAGIGVWQICPLGPTGYGDSPYQCFSAFAGNPYLIDLHDLVAKGLLTAAEVEPLARLDRGRTDFGALFSLKPALLGKAWERYSRAGCPPLDAAGFEAFNARNAGWLEDYALFRALKDHHGGRPWFEWPAPARMHAGAALPGLRERLAGALGAQRFGQYVFFAQWARLRAEAARRGIAIVGDIPIFVAADSADAWSRPDLFELDPATGLPRAVAGVPPDYFSADGQLWGNPLYAWDRHAADGFAWWHDRLRASFGLYDAVRIDHFRGFDQYWRIPYPARTAREGKWMPGPGLEFFRTLRAAFPGARIIAEDLGELTPSAVRLRNETGLPGMAILQFAFGGDARNSYLPHNLVANSVIYPGTHDNDTSLGWYAAADEATRDHARRYLRVDGRAIGWDFIRTAYGSVSRLAVVPLQDILSLGAEARFNTPGRPQGNWQWRLQPAQLEGLFAGTAAYLADLGALSGRVPAKPAA